MHSKQMSFSLTDQDVCPRPSRVIDNLLVWLYGADELPPNVQIPYNREFIGFVLMEVWEAYVSAVWELDKLKDHRSREFEGHAKSEARGYGWRLRKELQDEVLSEISAEISKWHEVLAKEATLDEASQKAPEFLAEIRRILGRSSTRGVHSETHTTRIQEQKSTIRELFRQLTVASKNNPEQDKENTESGTNE